MEGAGNHRFDLGPLHGPPTVLKFEASRLQDCRLRWRAAAELRRAACRPKVFSVDMATAACHLTERGLEVTEAALLGWRGVALRSCETAVTSCAGANGLANMMLLGTPLDAHSSASFRSCKQRESEGRFLSRVWRRPSRSTCAAPD